MIPTPRLAAAAVIVVVVAGTGFYLLRPQQNVGSPAVTPGPSLIGPSPVSSARPSTRPSTRPSAAAVQPKEFHSQSFAVPVSLTLVDGWRLDGEDRINVDLQHGGTDVGIMQMASLTVPGATAADPFVALPDDLAAWLEQRPEFGPVTSRAVTVGGRQGTLIDADFTWDGKSDTKFLRYGSGAWNYDRGTSGQRGRWIVLPGEGDTGVVIFMEGLTYGWDATSASLDRLLATVVFR